MSAILDLSPQEIQLLTKHLVRYVEHLDAELVRTDKHELQHALAREIETLRSIAQRLGSAAESAKHG